MGRLDDDSQKHHHFCTWRGVGRLYCHLAPCILIVTSFLIQIELEKHKNCARWPGTKPINLDLGFLGPANLEVKAGALQHLPEVEDLTVSVTQIFGLVVQSVLSEMQNILV